MLFKKQTLFSLTKPQGAPTPSATLFLFTSVKIPDEDAAKIALLKQIDLPDKLPSLLDPSQFDSIIATLKKRLTKLAQSNDPTMPAQGSLGLIARDLRKEFGVWIRDPRLGDLADRVSG